MNLSFLPLIILGIGFIAGQVVQIPLTWFARVTLLDACVVLALIFFAFRKKDRYVPRLATPILAFATFSLISLIWNSQGLPFYILGFGLVYLLRWLAYAALYWASAGSQYPSRVWDAALLTMGATIAVLGIGQYFLYPDLRNLYYLGWDPHFQRLFSTLLDPNFTGIIATVTALIFLSRLPIARTRVWSAIGLVISLVALALTYSRSSIIAFAVGVVVWGIMTGNKKVMVSVTVGFIMVLLLLPHTGEGRNLLRTASSYARVGSAQQAITLIREKPLFGHGLNIFPFVMSRNSWIDETIPSRAGAGIDTSVLFVGASTGIIGLLIYGWLLLRMYQLGRLAFWKDTHNRSAVALYTATISAVLTHSLFINSLFYPWVMLWVWISTGSLEQRVRSRNILRSVKKRTSR